MVAAVVALVPPAAFAVSVRADTDVRRALVGGDRRGTNRQTDRQRDPRVVKAAWPLGLLCT